MSRDSRSRRNLEREMAETKGKDRATKAKPKAKAAGPEIVAFTCNWCAYAGADYTRPGVFIAYSLTRNDSALTALGMLRDETERVTRHAVTEAELKTARESAQNRLVFQLAEPATVLFRTALYEVAGYPLDFLDRYQKALEGVTTAGMLEAAQRKIQPGQLVTVLVGKEKEFEKPLESLGQPVERVDIAIPPPPSKHAAKGAASAEALARGKSMLARAVTLAGGSAPWAALRSVTIESDAHVTMQGQSLALTSSQTWGFPDRQITIQKLPMGEMKQGVSKTGAWISMMGQVQDNPKGAEQVKKDYERSLFHLFARPEAFELQALDEPVKIGDAAYHAAAVKSALVQDWVLLFGDDGGLAGMQFMSEGQGGPAQMTLTYSDWRAEGAIRYPHALTMLTDGKPFMDGKVTAVRLDPAVSDETFARPAK